MKFELPRTTASFGVYNRREEKNKGSAFDLPFQVTVSAEIIGMLAPAQAEEGVEDTSETLIDELFSEEGYVKRPALNPLSINRKPEGATVTIWDFEHPDDQDSEPLELQPCRLTTLKAEMQSPHQVVLSGKIQYSQYTDDQLVRIDHICDKTFDLAITVEQVDLFEGESQENNEGSEE